VNVVHDQPTKNAADEERQGKDVAVEPDVVGLKLLTVLTVHHGVIPGIAVLEHITGAIVGSEVVFALTIRTNRRLISATRSFPDLPNDQFFTWSFACFIQKTEVRIAKPIQVFRVVRSKINILSDSVEPQNEQPESDIYPEMIQSDLDLVHAAVDHEQ
jgi:hypothetical protein